jgi:hypothetical protein
MLSPTQSFWRKRFTREVEPVLTACEKFYNEKRIERNNYIIRRNVRGVLQHTRDVSSAIMDVISDFADDIAFVEDKIQDDNQPDNLILASQLYLAIARLIKINHYLSSVIREANRLYTDILKFANDLRIYNKYIAQIKNEYDLTYHGEKMLYKLKRVTVLSRKHHKEEKEYELETQALLLNNLKKYCRSI